MNSLRVVGDVVFKEIGAAELPLALGVRRSVYVDELGYDAGAILSDPLDERAHHFLALTRRGKAIAAMRMLNWDARPFELEDYVDVADLSRPDGLAAEISRLCILSEYRVVRRHQFVHAGMWQIAYDCAVRWGLSDLWVWATPNIAATYRYLGFQDVTGAVFHHPLFRFQLYQVMRLRMLSLETEYRARHHALSSLLWGRT